MTGPTPQVRKAVFDRDAWRCKRCGWPSANFDTDQERWPAGLQLHHRLPRRMGGRKGESARRINDPANLVVLCRACHVWVESYRADALEAGWLLLENQDPATVPLVDGNGDVFDVDDGTVVQDRRDYYGPA